MHKHRESGKVYTIIRFLALATLISFTSVTVAIAIVSKGAIIYFYEPNIYIYYSEVLLGIFTISIGGLMLVNILKEVINEETVKK